MSARTKAARRSVNKRSWLVRILVIAVAAFLFLKLVQIHMQLEEKQNLITAMNESIHRQTLINEDLDEQIENADEYLEREANESGLYMPGQQIYQNAAG